MHITVRFFAVQRAQTGLRTLELELPDGSTVATAWAAIIERLPALEAATSSVRFAVNEAYAANEAPLDDGDELAVIPPVAGGAVPPARAAEGTSPPIRRIEIRAEPFADDLPAVLRAEVATAADGAVALFIGQTRETPGTPAPGEEAAAAAHAGQAVERLSYEAFEPMALAVLGDIADEIAARFGVRNVAIVHRVGEVPVGDASVIIATAAPHRGDAFDACRYAIEELKARAPIWKAERFGDGSVWMGAPPRTGPSGEVER